MGANLNDSMAVAIESASMVFVFMTAKYKESANCRKECEYADSNGIPITYIMAQENYKPNGWLGIQLGKAIWVPCWSPELIEASLPQLLDRAKPGAGAMIKTMPSAPEPPKSTSATTAGSGSNGGEILEVLKAMQKQISELSSTVEELKKDVKTILAQKKQE